jgi:hypothetical protein
MEKDYRKEIEELIGQMQCAKEFKCYKSGFDVLCKAKDVGTKSLLLLCLEENLLQCKFLNVERGYICECPLRNYVAKQLKK